MMDDMDDYKIFPHAIDSHCHLLFMKQRGIDVESMLQMCHKLGLSYALDVGVSQEDFEQRLSFKEKFPFLWFSAGIHPSSADKDNKGALSLIEKQLNNPNVLALGEIGLDYQDHSPPREAQQSLFRDQIEIAIALKKPLIIHNRNADEDILRILAPYKSFLPGGIFHCFSSDYEMAKKVLDFGFFLSFSGNITYKKSQNIRDTAKAIPQNTILTETDAPYLPPQPFRGKPNYCGLVGYVLESIASLKDINVNALAEQIEANFVGLFHLDRKPESDFL